MTTLPFVPYNKSNNDYSRENRKKPTLAELIVREKILKHRPLGYKFTRQKPLWSFIVDFYCSKLLLAIEVDGGSHNDKQTYDTIRDEDLRHRWITVIRYRNEDVIKNTEGVYEDIKEEIKQRIKKK